MSNNLFSDIFSWPLMPLSYAISLNSFSDRVSIFIIMNIVLNMCLCLALHCKKIHEINVI